EVSCSVDGTITCNANGVHANSYDTSSAASAVISTIPVLSAFESYVKTGTAASETEPTKVDSWKLTLTRTSTLLPVINTRISPDATVDRLKIAFEFTKSFDTVAEYERFKGGTSASASASPTEFSVIFAADNGVTLGSGRREIYFQSSASLHAKYSEAIPLNGKVVQTFTGMCAGFDSFYTVDNISSSNW
ncbi:MAG: hypothetical protein KDH96_08445, partial [Candidatus Riesia sp.]|nr:hypothetical protein [Candidatus Riesia sp.]